jgi:hypothetical protein
MKLATSPRSYESKNHRLSMNKIGGYVWIARSCRHSLLFKKENTGV